MPADSVPPSSLPAPVRRTVTWVRQAGSTLVNVDKASGEILRTVSLQPAPFGIAWKVERQGAYFVVRDDREISAYDAGGLRLWKRTSPTRVAFVGERNGRHITVIPDADDDGMNIALADLASGAFETVLHVDGTMQFVGAHGTLAGDLLFFVTDNRDVFAIDTVKWEVKNRYRMAGSHVLRPVATLTGVHAASIERRNGVATTHVATFDRETGVLLFTHTTPGGAHALVGGSTGLVIDSRRTPLAPIERTAFRPENPSVRLTVSKEVDMHLVRRDAPRLPSAGARTAGTFIVPSVTRVHKAHLVPAPSPRVRRDEMLPEPRNGTEGPAPTLRESLLGLLAVVDARSDVLTRLADAVEVGPDAIMRIQALGIALRDARARWSTGPGRDPCLLEIAENRDGDSIATYLYPPGKTGRLPVVLVSRTTGEARWLADDFDVWFAGVLHNAMAYADDAVLGLLSELALGPGFPRPLANPIPPPWFFEAHATRWTVADAETALASGDVEGAERMLVSAARTHAIGARERLATIYQFLGWDHHHATVVETW